MLKKWENQSALIAVGLDGSAAFLAYRGDGIAASCSDDEYGWKPSNQLPFANIPWSKPGLYVWEGAVAVEHTKEEGICFSWIGAGRPATSEDFVAFGFALP